MTGLLSIAASVIALATAAAQISNAISRLRHVGEVPGRFCALKNEVTHLEGALRQVGHALEAKSLASDNEQGALEQILARTKRHLADLAKALGRVANAWSGGKVKIITKSAIWWKEKALFQGFQEDIRPVKATLGLMLGAANSRDPHYVVLELRRVTVLTSYAGESQESIDMGSRDQHIALGTRIDQQHQELSTRFEALGKLILNGKEEDSSHPDQVPIPSEKAKNAQTLCLSTSHRVPCRSWCPCACHAKRKLKLTAPGMMENMLGKIFVGYSGLPVLNRPCDFRGCRDNLFPWWFVTMNLIMYLTYLPRTGPHIRVSTIRRVPDDSQSITFAMQGNIDGLQYLFSQGTVGPRDFSDSRGFALMRWALYGGMHNHETVRFLIDQGALVDEISYDNVWDFIFRGKCNDKEQYALRCITEGGEGDWVEEQNFLLIPQDHFWTVLQILSHGGGGKPNCRLPHGCTKPDGV